MESSNSGHSPKFTFCDNEGRAFISEYNDPSQFHVGDVVFVVRLSADGTKSYQGPYTIESVPSIKHYTLCHEDGRQALNGALVEEKNLEKHTQ